MNNIKKNFAYQSIYQILLVIMPLLTSPYLSRVIGAEGLGRYSYSYNVSYYFSAFITLGVHNYGNRCIARVREEKKKLSNTFWNIYIIQFGMGIVSISLYWLIIINQYGIPSLAFLQFFSVLATMFDITWFFFGIENFKITVSRNIFIKIATVISIFVFVKNEKDIWVYTLIMSGSVLISQLILWKFLIGKIYFVHLDWKKIKNNIKPMVILFVPVIAVSLYKIMDKIMLGKMATAIELGFYDNSEKVMNIPLGVITALGLVMMPRVANLLKKGEINTVNEYFKYSLKISMIGAAALSFGMAGIAPEFAPFFWGQEFVNTGKLIQVISITVIFISWSNVIRTQYLIPKDLDKIYLNACIIGAIVNFFINIFLIKSLGAMGAVIGTVCAELAVAIYETIKIKEGFKIYRVLIECIPYLIIGGIMFIIIRCSSPIFNNINASLIAEIFTGAIFYSAVSFFYIKYFDKELLAKITK